MHDLPNTNTYTQAHTIAGSDSIRFDYDWGFQLHPETMILAKKYHWKWRWLDPKGYSISPTNSYYIPNPIMPNLADG